MYLFFPFCSAVVLSSRSSYCTPDSDPKINQINRLVVCSIKSWLNSGICHSIWCNSQILFHCLASCFFPYHVYCKGILCVYINTHKLLSSNFYYLLPNSTVHNNSLPCSLDLSDVCLLGRKPSLARAQGCSLLSLLILVEHISFMEAAGMLRNYVLTEQWLHVDPESPCLSWADLWEPALVQQWLTGAETGVLTARGCGGFHLFLGWYLIMYLDMKTTSTDEQRRVLPGFLQILMVTHIIFQDQLSTWVGQVRF